MSDTRPPFYYRDINEFNARIQPSTVHVRNTGLSRYFKKYLLQKAISVFKWNLPKDLSENYFLYVLYCIGYIAIIETDKFGVIPQQCTITGYNVFYQPTQAIITNPHIHGIKSPRIGSECTLIRLQPNYSSIMDIVDYYGDLLALCAQSIGTNLVNSKLAYVFAAENKAASESFKKLFDTIADGEPAAFVDKNLFHEDGTPAWSFFSADLKNNYIVSDLLSDMRKIEVMFCTDIGINNANTDKRERLITDEVNANNFEIQSRAALWLEELQKACREANDMFGLDLSVDWRKPREAEGGTE